MWPTQAFIYMSSGSNQTLCPCIKNPVLALVVNKTDRVEEERGRNLSSRMCFQFYWLELQKWGVGAEVM